MSPRFAPVIHEPRSQQPGRTQMRAIQIDRFGGPEVLEVREVADPAPAAGELLVRTIASSINPVDVKTRGHVYDTGMPPLPMTLGWDLAGVVADPGPSALRPGQRVIAMSPQLAAGVGTWADLVVLPAGVVASAPARVSLAEAATVPLAGLTAWQALHWLSLTEGEHLQPIPGSRA
jgi:NADPH:quinone reductase-like Zn-dependent oxidoreductase